MRSLLSILRLRRAHQLDLLRRRLQARIGQLDVQVKVVRCLGSVRYDHSYSIQSVWIVALDGVQSS
jgi:hypothetical protein